jgi:hypothetical protein
MGAGTSEQSGSQQFTGQVGRIWTCVSMTSDLLGSGVLQHGRSRSLGDAEREGYRRSGQLDGAFNDESVLANSVNTSRFSVFPCFVYPRQGTAGARLGRDTGLEVGHRLASSAACRLPCSAPMSCCAAAPSVSHDERSHLVPIADHDQARSTCWTARFACWSPGRRR